MKSLIGVVDLSPLFLYVWALLYIYQGGLKKNPAKSFITKFSFSKIGKYLFFLKSWDERERLIEVPKAE